MLIIVRHGQSEANLLKKFAGHWNVNLTETGVKQAKISAEYTLENYKIDNVYASDLTRAIDTAKALADKLGKKVEAVEGIKEIFAGDWEGRDVSFIAEEYKEDYEMWKNQVNKCRPTNGESVKELYERIVPAFKSLAEENKGKIAYVVSHGGPIRCLMAHCMGGIDKMPEVGWISNASLTFLDIEDDRLTIKKAGFDEHLENFKTQVPKGI